ncbi:hypothetical protein [Streptomyces sp. NPDC056069]|uniref:hypothetical protein n=1 Tax=Streptomyces sp. NPDC056069 TaxID=3345702 RepID=UPI0035D87AF9
MNNAKMGTALIGGYLLGRTKSGKLAIGLAMALADSRIKPAQLGRSLAQSPIVGNVNQHVRGELMSAGKGARGTHGTTRGRSRTRARSVSAPAMTTRSRTAPGRTRRVTAGLRPGRGGRLDLKAFRTFVMM